MGYPWNYRADSETSDRMELSLNQSELAIAFEALVLFQPETPESERTLREASRALVEATPGKPIRMTVRQLEVAGGAVVAYCKQVPKHRRSVIENTGAVFASAVPS